MKRLTVYVSGKVQKVGYRKRVIYIARAFGIKGVVENLDMAGSRLLQKAMMRSSNGLRMPLRLKIR